MKKPRSQKRRIHDACIQSVSLNGPQADPVQLIVSPAGKPEKSVTFNLSWWQVRDLIHDLRKVAAENERQLVGRIQTIQNSVL